jgi:hypothetical protein
VPSSGTRAATAERRGAERHPVCLRGRCHEPSLPAAAWLVVVRDISDGGIGLVCPRPLGRGTVLVVALGDAGLARAAWQRKRVS